MIPFKDNVTTERFPAVTVALLVLSAVALLLAGQLLTLVLAAPLLWLFGATVEDATGHGRFAVLCALAGAAGAAPAGVAGVVAAAAAVAGVHVVLHPRGRVISVTLVPFLFTIVELPAPAVAAAGVALLAALVSVPAALIGAGIGLVLAKLLADPARAQPDPPRGQGYRVPVLGR